MSTITDHINAVETHVTQSPNGHVWELADEDAYTPGVVDFHAVSWDNKHNGPRCSVCGYSFCMWCKDEIPQCKGPALDTES